MLREQLWSIGIARSIIENRPHPNDEQALEHYWKPYLLLAKNLLKGGPIPFKAFKRDQLKIYLRKDMEPGNIFDAVSIAAERCSKEHPVPDIPIASDYDLSFLMAELEKVVVIKRVQSYR
jgi:hypothetical protein